MFHSNPVLHIRKQQPMFYKSDFKTSPEKIESEEISDHQKEKNLIVPTIIKIKKKGNGKSDLFNRNSERSNILNKINKAIMGAKPEKHYKNKQVGSGIKII